MDQRKIGSFLRELRKEKGHTQEEFAEIMRVSNRTVSRWETGVTENVSLRSGDSAVVQMRYKVMRCGFL